MIKANLDDLTIMRLLLFLETGPQTNHYQQVILTAEEFKQMSMQLGTVTATNGTKQDVTIALSDEVYPLPDLIEHKE